MLCNAGEVQRKEMNLFFIVWIYAVTPSSPCVNTAHFKYTKWGAAELLCGCVLYTWQYMWQNFSCLDKHCNSEGFWMTSLWTNKQLTVLRSSKNVIQTTYIYMLRKCIFHGNFLIKILFLLRSIYYELKYTKIECWNLVIGILLFFSM